MSEKKSPFAALEGLKSALPEGRPPAPAPTAATAPTVERFEAKVVVARSRKGRGGKTVTAIKGVRAAAREGVCRDLKKALGCGAILEDDTVVVLGDVADRVRGWLEAQGARRIVMGS